jgi:hypothetical protein
MATYIRLTDYKSSDEKEKGFFKPENRYEAKQEDFEKIPGSPIAYWVSKQNLNIFKNSKKLNDVSKLKSGTSTNGKNDEWFRFWFESEVISISFSTNSFNDIDSKFVPLNKGGEFRRWYGNNEYITKINFCRKGDFLFREGLTWSDVSSGSFSLRYKINGIVSNNVGKMAYPIEKKNELQLIAILNTKLINKYLDLFIPTMHFDIGYVGQLPIIFPKQDSIKKQIETLTQQNIDISKEEWDSRETSWDFKASPLLIDNGELKIENGKIEDVYNRYCDYWREKFYKLHKNEEELNRLFIEIYGLEDELTPDVPLEDITILKKEAKIIDNELVFQADEIMKQFISYGVGVMFGRYSLDSEGLLIANMNQEVPKSTTFEIDDDNVIPVLEDDYFSDDIVSRFIQFVKVVFGEEYLKENIQFIEKSLGTTLRKYFVKGFYEDHIKRYKKRPIYWMVASPKKGFMSLFYMHRYKSDIFATIQNSYLREYITKLEASRENYQREADDTSNSNTQRNKATKEITKINKTLDEVIKFDREVLTKYAQERVEIDLDDGVKVNYCKFKNILYPIKGLCK